MCDSSNFSGNCILVLIQEKSSIQDEFHKHALYSMIVEYLLRAASFLGLQKLCEFMLNSKQTLVESKHWCEWMVLNESNSEPIKEKSFLELHGDNEIAPVVFELKRSVIVELVKIGIINESPEELPHLEIAWSRELSDSTQPLKEDVLEEKPVDRKKSYKRKESQRRPPSSMSSNSKNDKVDIKISISDFKEALSIYFVM
jgi:hypothetical protein